jgi:ABC-type uncharacterized transport system ATPase subunit
MVDYPSPVVPFHLEGREVSRNFQEANVFQMTSLFQGLSAAALKHSFLRKELSILSKPREDKGRDRHLQR